MAVADTVLVAGNGQEALDLLRTHCEQAAFPTCPTVILLDMKMPRMNGFEFLRAYTRHSLLQNLAMVIMLTTSLNAQDVARMQDLPMAGFLTKPLTRKQN